MATEQSDHGQDAGDAGHEDGDLSSEVMIGSGCRSPTGADRKAGTHGYVADIPLTGSCRAMAPVEPRNGAEPKANTPPSEATSQ